MSEGGVDKRYLVAPNMGAGFESPQMVTDGSGAPVASFVFAGEHPLMKIVNGQPQYYLADTMGSVIGFADASGTSLGSLEYDGFGNARGGDALSADVAGDFRFQGMWKDPSGLYYVRARTYEAETGRFTSRDPALARIALPETHDPYSFAGAAPYVLRDPSGAFSLGELNIAGSIRQGLQTLAQVARGLAELRSVRSLSAMKARVAKLGTLPKGVLGTTDKFGNITIARGLSAAERSATLRHELVHRFFSPTSAGRFQQVRANVGQWAYNNSNLVRFIEETIAEAYGTGSMLEAVQLSFTAYDVSAIMLVMETVAYFAAINAAVELGEHAVEQGLASATVSP